MAYDIIIGRNVADFEKFGNKGIIHLGKHYVRMGRTTSMSNNVFMDITRSHVVLVTGKRGSGKSYTLSSIAESMSLLEENISNNLSMIILDTMGIFWTIKYPNVKDEDLLKEWNFEPKAVDAVIFTPKGFHEKNIEEGIPSDFPFSIKPSELNAEDWILTFGLNINDPIGILIERILVKFEENNVKNYSIKDILNEIEKDEDSNKDIKNVAKNRFLSALGWGLFDKEGTSIKELSKPGQITVLDVSAYTVGKGGWNVKSLVVGLIAKKLFVERMKSRKKEELEMVEKGYSYIGNDDKDLEEPLVWLILDEAHEFLPDEGKTSATDSLITILREGRQPGVSLILATQQPGKIHRDVITQSDLVISHRLTARPDIEALNSMMQSYMTKDLVTYFNNLPNEKGSALVLDDNSERIYPIRIKPKFSWHGGEAPTAIKYKRKLELEV